MAVDVALLTVAPDDAGTPVLSVLEVRRDADRGWQLPSTYLADRESLADAAARCLRDRAGVAATDPQQLHVFDHVERDGHGWALAVACLDVAPLETLEGRLDGTRVVAADAPGRLPHGHPDVLARAVAQLRSRYAAAPDPDLLLPETFTLRELRVVHEVVAGTALQRDTFRRTMEPRLLRTGEVTVGARGRPAETFGRG